MCYDNISFTKEQLALLEDRDVTIGDLQFGLDEKDAQLEEVCGRGGGREGGREGGGEGGRGRGREGGREGEVKQSWMKTVSHSSA